MAAVPVQVIYNPGVDSVDITDYVIFKTARLQSSAGAQPGTWQCTITDKNQELSFSTGKRVVWKLDGQVFYAGFLTMVSDVFAFPVDDTTGDVSEVKTREFILRGVDYNILFDKRVFRDPTNYLKSPDQFAQQPDTDLIATLTSDYLDLPNYLDTSSEVQNVSLIPTVNEPGAWVTQGSPWRMQMDEFAKITGATYYIKPDPDGGALLYWVAVEDNEAPYVLSDKPEGDERGFRELDHLVDASGMVNDALVWGGNEFSPQGSGVATVFAREQNEDSIDDHGRWQWAETHFNDPNYASQDLVDFRAAAIVTGKTGDTVPEQNRGLQRPNRTFRLAWHHRDVPQSGGDYTFIYPGHLTTLKLHVFGDGVDPLVEVLPCRSINVTFPGKETEDSFVRFEGEFSLQRNDPWTLWQAIKRVRKNVIAGL